MSKTLEDVVKKYESKNYSEEQAEELTRKYIERNIDRQEQDVYQTKKPYAYMAALGALGLLNIKSYDKLVFPKGDILYPLSLGIIAILGLNDAYAYYTEKEKLEILKKYRYFLDHKDTINREIITQFNEDEETEGYEPNTMSIYDVDKYSLKELQETVSLNRLALRRRNK